MGSSLKIGIIGGSGLYAMEGLANVREVTVETPFGPPSDAIVHGHLGEAELFFLPRHGRGHRLLPSELPLPNSMDAPTCHSTDQDEFIGAVPCKPTRGPTPR